MAIGGIIMTIEEQKETIDSFDEFISKTIRYQMIEDIDAIASIVHSHLKNSTKLNKDQKNLLINNFCMDYLYNFTEKNKPNSLTETCMKFQNDKAFAQKIISVYIDKYFPNDLKINNFNVLCLEYSEEPDINEGNIVFRLYQVLVNSSYFTNDEKILILNHLLIECKNDVDNLKRFDDYPCDEDFLDGLTSYEEQGAVLMQEIENNKDFCLQLIEYYFQVYIQEDYRTRKFEHFCYSVVRNDKILPTKLQIKKIYDKVVEMDEIYDYKDFILNIITLASPENELNLEELVKSDIDEETDYKSFINDTQYGMGILEKYLKTFILELEEYNIELVNDIARQVLIDLIDPNVTIGENVNKMNYYLKDIHVGKALFNSYYNKYNIPVQEIILYQKVCLISDYYNNHSDCVLNQQTDNHVQLIRTGDLSEILKIFDNNSSFSNCCVENFIKQTLDPSEYNEGICNDRKTLEKINPFFKLEQLNNKAYQKKISN